MIANGTNRVTERVGDPNEFSVSPGSSLFGDDEHSDPYQLSHAVQMCLVARIDHLHTAKSHLLDFHVLPAASLFSLVRGALENFGAAYWMLGPKGRDERITRSLRWHAKNFKDQKTAMEPFGKAEATTLDVKLAKLYAVADRRGIATAAVRGGYTSTEALEYSGEMSSRCDPLFAWRLCSGYAHGRPWAYLGSADQEQFETTDPDVVKLKLTGNQSRVLYPAQQAYHLMVDVGELQQRRAKTHCAKRSRNSCSPSLNAISS